MITRERKEARLVQRQEWAIGAKVDADRSVNRALRALDGIEPGQPILVGHHSEGKHRAAIKRSDSAMRHASERYDMAKEHSERAANIERQLATTIFSDDDNATEALREKIRDLEAQAERIKALNVKIRKEHKAGLPAGWLERIGATDAEKARILENVRFDWRHEPMFPGYVLTNLRGRIRQAEERVKAIETRSERNEAAEQSGGVSVERFAEHNWCRVTFAEKPSRDVLAALRSAGYRWGAGCWSGRLDALPDLP